MQTLDNSIYQGNLTGRKIRILKSIMHNTMWSYQDIIWDYSKWTKEEFHEKLESQLHRKIICDIEIHPLAVEKLTTENGKPDYNIQKKFELKFTNGTCTGIIKSEGVRYMNFTNCNTQWHPLCNL